MESSSCDSRIVAVRALSYQSRSASPASRPDVALIALGLALLAANIYWSAPPAVVSAVAIIALGATYATTRRLAGATNRCWIITIHLFVYFALYLLFVGALWHAALQSPRGSIGLLESLDIAASLVPMGLVVRRSLAAIAAGGGAPIR
jgi:hypothetical protein